MRIFRNWSSWRRLRYVIVTVMAVAGDDELVLALGQQSA